MNVVRQFLIGQDVLKPLSVQAPRCQPFRDMPLLNPDDGPLVARGSHLGKRLIRDRGK